jgi:alkanesulfonate monooxygenase SsuD/methylene tetrahydromethanopterin reductase-like flavin-dependent oxidoreductase (luciferase family)
LRFGVYAPNFGDYADPRALLALARDSEEAGWQGFFLYDHLVGDAYGVRPGDGVVDPWIALAGVAAVTSRVRIGPLVTAVSRRRPWKLAREVASLDHLSAGRAILGVGLGGRAAFAPFGEEADDRVRADRLDEGLELMAALWSGREVRHRGAHYRAEGVQFLPSPVQTPRPPVWVAGVWPNRRPFRRAARWDGVFPLSRSATLPTPAQIREIRDYVLTHRTDRGAFDLTVGGATVEPDDAAAPAASAEAGATWWLEWLGRERGPLEAMRARVRAGPPRLADHGC